MPGRGGCVSFYRPDDLEALLAICPQMMFRPRRFQFLDGSYARREGMGRSRTRRMVASLLRVAGADHLATGPVGDHARQPRSPFPVQRWPAQRLAFWTSWLAGLAYGWINRPAGAAMRAIPSRLPRVDWRPEEGAGGMRSLSCEDGRSFRSDGQSLAPAPYASRHGGRLRLPIFERRQHKPRAEWASLRLAGSSRGFFQAGGKVVRAQRLRRQTGGKAT